MMRQANLAIVNKQKQDSQTIAILLRMARLSFTCIKASRKTGVVVEFHGDGSPSFFTPSPVGSHPSVCKDVFYLLLKFISPDQC